MQKSLSCAFLDSGLPSPGCHRVAIKDEADVLDRKIFDSLPPPHRYVQPAAKQADLTLTIMTSHPYQVVDASSNLCAMLKVSAAQIKGRTISILNGPDTDSSSIPTAIKSILADTRRSPTYTTYVKIYGQDQQSHEMKARCSRTANCGDDFKGQCFLRFEAAQPGWMAAAVGLTEDEKVRKAARSRLNFLTGLEMHLQYRRVAAGECGRDCESEPLCAVFDQISKQ